MARVCDAKGGLGWSRSTTISFILYGQKHGLSPPLSFLAPFAVALAPSLTFLSFSHHKLKSKFSIETVSSCSMSLYYVSCFRSFDSPPNFIFPTNSSPPLLVDDRAHASTAIAIQSFNNNTTNTKCLQEQA